MQQNNEFIRIKPGLWALTDCKEDVLKRLNIENNRDSDKAFTHSYYQGMIVELGNMHRYRTYIPSQDKNKFFLEKKLSEISTEADLPPFTYDSIARRAKTVDVIWFNNRKMPCGFYEVEHTTDIEHSLNKFYALQDFRADFYIIADENKHRHFDSLMEQSIYSSIKDIVKFFNYENLVKQYEKECSLAAIERL